MKKKIIGGVGAIANQLAPFVYNSKIITYFGDCNNKISFIKKNIKKNIIVDYFIKKKKSNNSKN